MKIGEKKARSIIQKSGLSENSYCVNTFSGCSHACVYCYACFMRRFSGHDEPWGEFVDAKINAAALFPREFRRLRGGEDIFFGSVTDVYQPLEKKYRLMRGILEFLAEESRSPKSGGPKTLFSDLEPEEEPRREVGLTILTKSDLVLRDLDLLREIPKIAVGFSVALLDEKARAILEPGASPAVDRIAALEKLHDAGIRTFVFINPFLPHITPLADIFAQIAEKADSVFGETLNTHCGNLPSVFRAVGKYRPELLRTFKAALDDTEYKENVKNEFVRLAKEHRLVCDGFFLHRGEE